MGKNKRKKKQKQEDFKKVKLKVGKSRPVGANETGTSFKSRAVVIPAQEKDKDGELTNVRKQSLKDLFSQLCHYSPTVRQEALLGLRGLFQQHENVLHDNLGEVLQKVTEKVTDTDATVRHSLLLLFKYTLPLISADRLAPFLPLVHAHLSCAMTHITDDIQLESLGFLALFLEHFPYQITSNSTQLLQNFLGLITYQGSVSNTTPAIGRSRPGGSNLLVNQKGKLSTQKSRLKILSQLLDFLKAQYASSLEKSALADVKSTAFALKVKSDKPAFVQIFDNSARELKYNGQHFPMGERLSTDEKESTAKMSCKEFLTRVIPLLLECWVECSPVEMSSSLPNNMQSSTQAAVMATVMNILKVLLAVLECQTAPHEQENKKAFLSKYLKDFSYHFMTFFPFSETSSLGRKGKVKQQDPSGDTSARSLNISICEVMSHFLADPLSSASAKWETQVEDFVVKTLTSGGSLSNEHVNSLLGFAQKVLNPGGNWLSCDTSSELLSAVLSLYKGSHLLSATRKAVFHFFAMLVTGDLEDSPIRLEGNLQEIMKSWLASLPKLLNQLKESNAEMTEAVLRVLKRALIQDPTLVNKEQLNKQLATFCVPSRGPFVHLSSEVQRSTIELLYQMESIDTSLLQSLAGCCNHVCVPVATVQYMIQVLHYRSPVCEAIRPPSVGLASYLSVLFSIAIGLTHKDLTSLQSNTANMTKWLYHFIADSAQNSSRLENSGRDSGWKRRQSIQKTIHSHYRQCNNADKLLVLMVKSLENILELRCLPIGVADSILQLLSCLIELSNAPSEVMGCDLPSAISSRLLLHRVTGLISACLLHCVTSESNDVRVIAQVAEDAYRLLAVSPQLMREFISLLQTNISESPDEIAMVTTKLMKSPLAHSVMILNSDSIDQLVVALTDLPSLPSKSRADLVYQHSLFTKSVCGSALDAKKAS